MGGDPVRCCGPPLLARDFCVMSEVTFTEVIPLAATDAERAALEDDLAAFVADLRAAGMNPVVGVETTSGGDVFVITADEGIPS